MIKGIIKPIIILWEKYFSWKEKIQLLDGSPYNLLRYKVTNFEGKPMELPDGTQIKPGDPVMEIHMSNTTVSKGKIGDIEVSSDLQILSILREEMKLLASMLNDGKPAPNIKALWGTTLFGAGVRRLGFSLRPMEQGWGRTSQKLWMSFLRWVFAPAKVNSKSKSRSARQPDEIFMSKDQLFKKYLS